MITGSLKERYGRWYAIIRFNNDNKQTQKWINTGFSATGNKKNAKKFLDEKIDEYSAAEIESVPIKEKKLLFCDFLTEYLEIRKPNIEDITYSGYKFILKHILAYFEKSKLTLDALTPLHVQKYYTARLKEVSSNSVRKHHTFIRSALAYARNASNMGFSLSQIFQSRPYLFASMSPNFGFLSLSFAYTATLISVFLLFLIFCSNTLDILPLFLSFQILP